MQLTTVFRYEGKILNRKTKSTACYHDGKPLVMWKVDEAGNWSFDSELNLEKEIGEGLFLVSIVVHKIEPEGKSIEADDRNWINLLGEEDELLKMKRLLELHRRFHSKAGCPGGDDCYVCIEERENSNESR